MLRKTTKVTIIMLIIIALISCLFANNNDVASSNYCIDETAVDYGEDKNNYSSIDCILITRL